MGVAMLTIEVQKNRSREIARLALVVDLADVNHGPVGQREADAGPSELFQQEGKVEALEIVAAQVAVTYKVGQRSGDGSKSRAIGDIFVGNTMHSSRRCWDRPARIHATVKLQVRAVRGETHDG